MIKPNGSFIPPKGDPKSHKNGKYQDTIWQKMSNIKWKNNI
jgi:hypothetical protein